MAYFWISWWSAPSLGGFTLATPWWVTGSRYDEKEISPLISEDAAVATHSICAAVSARNEAKARELIKKSYDKEPVDLEWRFCYEKPADWIPFSDRFPKSGWMTWPPKEKTDEQAQEEGLDPA